jgi:uncharacterized membrane protein
MSPDTVVRGVELPGDLLDRAAGTPEQPLRTIKEIFPWFIVDKTVSCTQSKKTPWAVVVGLEGELVESKAKIMGHPILIPFPLGLLSTSVVFDVVYLITGNGKWSEISFWMIAAGVIGGLAAAVFGLIDWLAIPSGTRAKAVGMWHGATNVVMVTIFIVGWLLRADAPGDPGIVAIVLSIVAVGLASLGGFLGGELVVRLGVGVAEGAHLNAPSSLSERAVGRSSTGPRREE